MKKFIQKITGDSTLTSLFVLSIIVFLLAMVLLIAGDSSTRWLTEVGKSLLSLSMTVIIGGFVKIFIDERQKEKDEWQKKELLKKDILDRLRHVFDSVETSRLLINAHRSAKTYGEQMRSNIIPSIPVLFDIKRSMVGMNHILQLTVDEITLVRIEIHYMIAYLTALSKEYEAAYVDISHYQYFQEAAKEAIKKRFQQHYNEHSLQDLPAIPEISWEKMSALQYVNDFISNSYDRKYNDSFTDPFESIKKILRGFYKDSAEIKEKLKADAGFVRQLQQQDDKKNMIRQDSHSVIDKAVAGEMAENGMRENLVLRMMVEKLGYQLPGY